MLKAAISVSYCGEHVKGGDPGSGVVLPGHLHARMLADTVELLADEYPGWPIIVCATAFPGLLRVDTSPEQPERDHLWRTFGKSRWLSIPGNPGHQSGANWSIRMGVEGASKLGVDYLVHTAEDVVPNRGAVREMVKQMDREGSDYCGEPWGVNQDELNAQFFGCRVSWFATWFDGAGIGVGWTERYLDHLVKSNDRRMSLIGRVYQHTHDPEEHLRFILEARAK